MRSRLFDLDKLFSLADPPDYEPTADASIAARAARLGVRPEELAYDLLLEKEGRAILYRPLLNYVDGNLDVVLAMLQHRDTVIGLSDGGAHVGMICDASLPTFMLAHWARDRSRGIRLDLPRIVRSLTSDTAGAVGLHDRGVVQAGYKADLNVIDFDKLHLHAPDIAHDLPLGGRRLIQKADGYAATIVSGTVVSRDGTPTGALPGRLIRGQQARPTTGA
jgi:N-acyl-D-aspartate/D-glutamate deacylase